jgi:hypothetical protein
MPDSERSPKRRVRLSEEERKRLWHKAVMEKAKKLKGLTDIIVFVLLLTVIAAHGLTFVWVNRGRPEEFTKRGYEIVIDLLKPYEGDVRKLGEEEDPPNWRGYWRAVLRKTPDLLWGVHPRMLYARSADGQPLQYSGGRYVRKFRPIYPATILAYLYLLVPFGAVVVLVLYLLDYKLWMGRFLPALSGVYGFGLVAYLMLTRVPLGGTWNALRYGSALAWYLILIPLFLVGAASLLRYVVSERWKRYEWAGLEIPEHLRPRVPEEGKKEEKKKEEGEKEEVKAEQAEQAEQVEKAEKAEQVEKVGEAKETEKSEKAEEAEAGEAEKAEAAESGKAADEPKGAGGAGPDEEA